jgi:hypothetical protein
MTKAQVWRFYGNDSKEIAQRSREMDQAMAEEREAAFQAQQNQQTEDPWYDNSDEDSEDVKEYGYWSESKVMKAPKLTHTKEATSESLPAPSVPVKKQDSKEPVLERHNGVRPVKTFPNHVITFYNKKEFLGSGVLFKGSIYTLGHVVESATRFMSRDSSYPMDRTVLHERKIKDTPFSKEDSVVIFPARNVPAVSGVMKSLGGKFIPKVYETVYVNSVQPDSSVNLSQGQIRSEDRDKDFFTASTSTVAGDSGSPVFWVDDEDNTSYLVGLHMGGSDSVNYVATLKIEDFRFGALPLPKKAKGVSSPEPKQNPLNNSLESTKGSTTNQSGSQKSSRKSRPTGEKKTGQVLFSLEQLQQAQSLLTTLSASVPPVPTPTTRPSVSHSSTEEGTSTPTPQ